jgi:hypothetical protein
LVLGIGYREGIERIMSGKNPISKRPCIIWKS